MKCDLDAEVRRYEKKMGLGPVAPRDREIAVLRAQVRVLVQWACCPRTAGLAVDCPEGGECDCYACTERVSRQQAEKEVQP